MMIAFLGVISFFVFIIFGILFVVSLFKRKNRKRNAVITGVSFVLFISFVLIDSDGLETVDNSQNDENQREEQEKKDKEEQDKKDKEEQDKKDKEEQDKKDKEEQDKKDKEEQDKKDKEEQDKKDKEKEEVKTVVEKMEDYDVVKSAELDGGELILTYEPGMGWSENSLFRTVYDSFEVTNQAFKDDSVDSVLNLIEGVMVDPKGNEEMRDMITYRYQRSDFEELNYNKFKEMALGEQWRILNEAEGYFIHPGIRANLKEKYTDNLN